MPILKMAFIISAAIAAAALAFALARLVPCAAPLILRGRDRVAREADTAGVQLSPRICSALSLFAPAVVLLLAVIRKRRLIAADRQLPDALALIGNAMRAGLSLAQALEMASLELASPLGGELVSVVAQLKLGRTAEEALAILAERVPTEDVCLVVQSVEVLRRTGGNLIETFGTLAATVEGRLHVEERIRVLTAQGVYQGAMLLAMPWLLGVALYMVAPDYIEPLVATRLGHLLVAFGILLEALGAAWLRSIVMIRV
ncbi:MAG: type II secretion system F family protein [Pseudomonadota bacterium]